MAKVFLVALKETICFSIEAESKEDVLNYLEQHTVGEVLNIAYENEALDRCTLSYNDTILGERDDLIPVISILKGEK